MLLFLSENQARTAFWTRATFDQALVEERMELLSSVEVWRWFRWLPKFVLSKVFTQERLSDLVLIDLRPRHSSASIELSEHPQFELWFQIVNMSPFTIELKKAEFDFSCAGTSIKTHYIRNSAYKSGEISDLHVTGDVPEGKADTIAKLRNKNRSRVSFYCEFESRLGNFVVEKQHLDGVNVEYKNADYRSQDLQ